MMATSMLAFARGAGAAPRADSASRRVSCASALLAVACVLGLVEAGLPPVAVIPWLRIGLANVAVVVALVMYGPSMAAVVSVGRLVIVAMITGSFATPVFLMSAVGAVLSLLVMVGLARAVAGLSPVGLSAAGSAAHVIGQFIAAAVLLRAASLLVLAPPSVLVALILGAATGVVAGLTVSRLQTRPA